MELTPCLYACGLPPASGFFNTAREAPIPRRFNELSCEFRNLLDEQTLAQLVAANEGLHGAESSEQFLDFTILQRLLCR